MKDMNWPERVAYLENQLADSDRDNRRLREFIEGLPDGDEIERLRGELLLITQLQAGDGSTVNGLTKDQLGRAFRQAQDIARAALGIVTHGDSISGSVNPDQPSAATGPVWVFGTSVGINDHIEFCYDCHYSRVWIAEHGHGKDCPHRATAPTDAAK